MLSKLAGTTPTEVHVGVPAKFGTNFDIFFDTKFDILFDTKFDILFDTNFGGGFERPPLRNFRENHD